jgi:hypothetical protein
MAKKDIIKDQSIGFTEPEYITKQRDKDGRYYYTLFQKAYNFDSFRFEDYRELMAFYELAQDELPEYNKEKPWVYNINAPYATDAINLRVASLQANDYLGELQPLSPDDTETVQKLNFAYQAMWQEMNMDKHINDSILRSSVMREAYTHIIFKNEETGGTNRKRQGKLKGYFIDAASVHVDPKAQNLKEADFIIITERITPKQVKKKYPNYQFERKTSSKYMPEERGEIYYGTDFTTEQEFVLTKMTFYEREEDGIYKTVLVEDQIVEDSELIPINYFPIAQLRWQKKLKSPYGTSLMDMLLPLQKTVNEIESAVANSALQFSSPSYVLSEESGIDPEDLALTAGTPGAIYVSQAGSDINNIIRPLIGDRKVDEQLVAIKQEIERTIYKLAGVSDTFLGSMGTVGNTRTGTDMAIQRAKIIEQRFLVNLEEYVEDIARIIVSFIIEAFGGEYIYVRGPKQTNGEFQFSEMEIPEVDKDLEYTFYVKLDVKTKYTKEQHRLLMLELYQAQIQYDAPVKGITFIDVLRNYDVPNIEEIVERFEKLTNMDGVERAQLVMMITTMSQEFGIDQGIVAEAIAEIMQGKKETPLTDAILAQIEQAKEQQMRTQQMVQQGLMQNELERQMQEPTGDEILQADGMVEEGGMNQDMNQGMEPTGDEVLEPQMM